MIFNNSDLYSNPEGLTTEASISIRIQLAKIPSIARDSIRNDRTQENNYGII
jgi:hypothetical protein